MTESLRVVRIIARLNVGGPARQVLLLDHRLRARGWDSLVAHGRVAIGESSFEESARISGVRLHPIPELGRRIHVWSDLVAFARLLSLIWCVKPDVVHTHTAKAGALGRVASDDIQWHTLPAPPVSGRAHVSWTRAEWVLRTDRQPARAHD